MIALPTPFIPSGLWGQVPFPPIFIFTGGTIGFGPLLGGGPNLTPPLLYALKGKNLDVSKVSVVFLAVNIGFFNIGCIGSLPLFPPVGVGGVLFDGTLNIGDPDNAADVISFFTWGAMLRSCYFIY